MQTKKITELLELLDDPSFFSEITFCSDLSGRVSTAVSKTIFFEDLDHMNEQLTNRWNQLTGDNLKDVTWVI